MPDFSLQAESEFTVLRIVAWFYTQMGPVGVVLLCAAALGLVAWLVSYQIKKDGFAKVVKVYSVILFFGLIFHFAFSGDRAAGVSELSEGEVAREATFESEAEDDSLHQLSERLKKTRTRSTLGSRPSREDLIDPDKGLLDDMTPMTWVWLGVLAAGLILFLRTKPAFLSPAKLKLVLKGSKAWIRPTRSQTNELGSSDFATSEQIKEWLKPKGQYDTKLHVSELRSAEGIVVKKGELIMPVGHRNRHMLIIAKTGGGKTTKMILPILYNDCICPYRSTIVIDSKQEMWQKLAGLTRKHNPEKNIVLFNPLDKVRSLSWNILAKIENDTDCKLIANSVIMATDEPQAKQDSPFFRNSALQVLNALMVGLLHDPDEILSMPRIHELLNLGMLPLCDWLEAHPKAVRTTRAFIELARSGSQNADTIMSELSMRIQAWDLSAIRATTFADEIDIEKIIKEPTLMVVELRESELKMLRPLANVIVVELLRYLTKYAEECDGQTLPRPVGLVCDEFASALGRLPDIHIKLNTLRSRNVSIVAAIQSIGQIKGNYGEDWESVISGFSTKIFMPTLDYMDSEWASKESGTMTVKYKTQNRGSNRKITENFSNRNVGSNEYLQQRQVLTPAEVGRPNDNQATFFLPETPVFQGHLIPFYKIPTMKAAIDEFASQKEEIRLRSEPIDLQEKDPEPVYRNKEENVASTTGGHQEGAGLSEAQLWEALEEIKTKDLDWGNTVGDARQWWQAFEEENKHRIALVLKVAQEIQQRKASITDFFLAYVYSNTDNIQATLAYLDYTMHMKVAEMQAS